MIFTRLSRLILLPLGLLVLFALSGCGNSETSERKAFIEFLQTRINDKAGLRIPHLTNDEKQRLGQYASQFEIIRAFHDDLNSTLNPLMVSAGKAMGIMTPQSILEKRGTLAEIRKDVQLARKNIQDRFAKAQADYAALQQPEDLKPVYAAAFKRTIVTPSEILEKFLVSIDDALSQSDALAQFLDTHKQEVKFSGITVEVEDQKLLDQLNTKLDAVKEAGNRLRQTQQELRKLISG